MMKRTLIASVVLAGFVAGLTAQGPIQPGSETVARPRKKVDPSNADKSKPVDSSEQTELPKIPSKLTPKQKEEVGADASFKAETNIVNVDVAVLDNKGNFIPNIPRGNFRILEDNVPQTLTQYSIGQAPMTVALVVEFSNRFQSYWSYGWYETLQAAYGFTQTLRPDDYLAVIAYDLRTEILSDFTNDKSKIGEAMSRLRIPGFSESNMFDALTETADRMSKIEGRRAIVIITSGIDTFSKITYDKTRKLLQESGVPVYSISILQLVRTMAESRGANMIDFLQGDNEMRTFAKETGGQAFFPRFMGEMPNNFAQINQALRNQYSLGYSPTNQARDGKFRKLTVQLINPATNEPLRVTDEKNKPIKYTIIAKAGYKAPLPVE
ncbi:MAG TPA: VWA domain-containing protein [Bryobacteraceae bacterium]|nr:VWA domain-containing protein [Bryobacteraceae bacterium]